MGNVEVFGDRHRRSTVEVFKELYGAGKLRKLVDPGPEFWGDGPVGVFTCPDGRRCHEARGYLDRTIREACGIHPEEHPNTHYMTWHGSFLRIWPESKMSSESEAAFCHHEVEIAYGPLGIRKFVSIGHYLCGWSRICEQTQFEYIENYVEALLLLRRDFPEAEFIKGFHLENSLLEKTAEENRSFSTYGATIEDLQQYLKLLR